MIDPYSYGPSKFPSDGPIGTKRYLTFKKEVIEVTYCSDGLWRDNDGSIIGIPSEACGWSDPPRAGVGIFELPASDPISQYSRSHDYSYSCPAVQIFYSREEADKFLHDTYDKLPGWRVAVREPFYFLARVFGWMFWENKENR